MTDYRAQLEQLEQLEQKRKCDRCARPAYMTYVVGPNTLYLCSSHLSAAVRRRLDECEPFEVMRL